MQGWKRLSILFLAPLGVVLTIVAIEKGGGNILLGLEWLASRIFLFVVKGVFILFVMAVDGFIPKEWIILAFILFLVVVGSAIYVFFQEPGERGIGLFIATVIVVIVYMLGFGIVKMFVPI